VKAGEVPEGEARDHGDHIDGDGVGLGFGGGEAEILRTVGWKAVAVAATMLQAKQERSLLNPLEGIGR
jgi:hypothetical protein